MKKLLYLVVIGMLLLPFVAQGISSYEACCDILEDGTCSEERTVEYEGLVPCGRSDIIVDCPGQGNEDGNMPCQLCHIFILFKTIIDFFLLPPSGLLWLIALLMVVVAGFLYLIGYVVSADANLVRQANQILKTTFLGLAITLVSWIVINVFFIALGVADWTGLNPSGSRGWFQIECPVEVAPVGPGT